MTLPITFVDSGRSPTSPKFGAAFVAGLRDEAAQLVDLTPPEGEQLGPLDVDAVLGDAGRGERPPPIALFPSPRIFPLVKKARDQRRTFYYGDHGYFSRKRFFRVTRNDFQYHGTDPGCMDRWLVHRRTIREWRMYGDHILVCPNSPLHFQLRGEESADAWTRRVVAELQEHTDRPIRIRWKPWSLNDRDQHPIEHHLADCWACVTYSSASALDALIQGVPSFTLSEESAAHDLSLHDLSRIEDPMYPQHRERLMIQLASQQWTLSEIRNGTTWRKIGRH